MQTVNIENNQKQKRYFKTNSISELNKVLSLQIINILLFIVLIFFNVINIRNYKPHLINKDPNININNNNLNIMANKIKLLKLITNNDEFEYKRILECLLKNPDTEHCIYHLILPKKVLGRKRILLGEKHDGCYVLLDDFKNIKIAYSFGINTNIQFDKALADKGIDVFMYDHSINSLPYENPKFHWKKIGLCGKNTQNNNFKNLEDLIIENGHVNEKNMILKMDIEYSEWDAIIDLKEETLNQFKYIAIEYHFKDESVFKNNNLYYNVLKKMSKTHQAFYARCNGDRDLKINFGNNRICHIIEVSYIIKKGNSFIKDDTIYPIYEFDYSKPKLGKLEMNLNLLKLFDE